MTRSSAPSGMNCGQQLLNCKDGNVSGTSKSGSELLRQIVKERHKDSAAKVVLRSTCSCVGSINLFGGLARNVDSYVQQLNKFFLL